MSKNLTNQKGFNKPSRDDTPGGMQKMDPAPGGGMIRNIKGPGIHTTNKGGDLKNNTGVDGGTSVVSD